MYLRSSHTHIHSYSKQFWLCFQDQLATPPPPKKTQEKVFFAICNEGDLTSCMRNWHPKFFGYPHLTQKRVVTKRITVE